MNKIVVTSVSKKWPALEKVSRRIARDFLVYFKKDSVSLEIYLVDDLEMTDLNHKFRDKNYPTNVLSFPAPKDWPSPFSISLGEIYIAPDYIENKKENFEYLLVHALLHILGFDHERKDDRIIMEIHEAEVCKALGISA